MLKQRGTDSRKLFSSILNTGQFSYVRSCYLRFHYILWQEFLTVHLESEQNPCFKLSCDRHRVFHNISQWHLDLKNQIHGMAKFADIGPTHLWPHY